jgi:hypothetical protein
MPNACSDTSKLKMAITQNMTKKVFIHTNEKQMVGAIVSQHSLKRQSSNPHAFEVEILKKESFDFFSAFEGRKFLRSGGWRTWKNQDLQSFTPTRFLPPELMNYQGRAVVIDPDVFAIGDVMELLDRDMGKHAVMAKPRAGHNGRNDYVASSVMLLACDRLKHWNVQKQFASMFEGKLDYEDWIVLRNEPEGTVGFIESYWNDFDKLTSATRLLHNTKRNTQPWKTGLPIDYTNRIPLIGKFFPDNGIKLWGNYKKHPDPLQEELFFAYLKECLDNGMLTEAVLTGAIEKSHVRKDAFAVAHLARSVDVILADAKRKA